MLSIFKVTGGQDAVLLDQELLGVFQMFDRENFTAWSSLKETKRMEHNLMQVLLVCVSVLDGLRICVCECEFVCVGKIETCDAPMFRFFTLFIFNCA